jgi:hypothetical protein
MLELNKNNLSKDPSPYLQQHKKNPVNWQAWSKEVLKTASKADFLGTPKFDNKLIGFSDVEIQKIKRSYDWMSSERDAEKLLSQRSNFGRFFNAHDERRGTDFRKTFPELADFFEYCLTL